MPCDTLIQRRDQAVAAWTQETAHHVRSMPQALSFAMVRLWHGADVVRSFLRPGSHRLVAPLDQRIARHQQYGAREKLIKTHIHGYRVGRALPLNKSG